MKKHTKKNTPVRPSPAKKEKDEDSARQTADDTELLTAAELAAIYKVQKQKVLQWFHEKRIPAEVAIGKIYRFDRQKVAAALAKDAKNRPGVIPKSDRCHVI